MDTSINDSNITKDNTTDTIADAKDNTTPGTVANVKDVNKKTSISPYWGIGLGVIAIILAIVAIVLLFVLKPKEGPQGPRGNDGTSGMAIKYSLPAVFYSTERSNYTLPPTYNYTNIVIPSVPSGRDVYFTIDVDMVTIGDVFVIDNTNNRTSKLYVQYKGFDNNLSKTSYDEISVNKDSNGVSNSIYAQISSGKSDSSKNIILLTNFS